MRVLELWFPGFASRPTYSYEKQRYSKVSATWDCWDLQEQLSISTLPHIEAMGLNAQCWFSSSALVGFILNGYANDIHLWNEHIKIWRNYDVLVVHWWGPMEIAASLHGIWALRKQYDYPKIVLWGRKTSYGRDCSRDLRHLEHNIFLTRLFDAIVCSESQEKLDQCLYFLSDKTEKRDSPLSEVLLSVEGIFEWHDDPQAKLDSPAAAIAVRSLNSNFSQWAGSGIPQELTAPAAHIIWQPQDARELLEGIAKLQKWKKDAKQIEIEMPAKYPWGGPALQSAALQFIKQSHGRVSQYHNYKIELPFDLPDYAFWANTKAVD